jgi:glycosyltransferase involved in cell wall biosynthesis
MKNKIPLVSVLINNYNKEKFCKKAVNSILNQNYDNIEIIFYDDYSEDRSLDQIKEIKKKIKIIKNKSRQKIYSHNQMNAIFKSLEKSKGEIVCILDSDDFFSKNKVKKVVNFFIQNKNCDILFDRPIIYQNNKNKFKSYTKYTERKYKWPIFPPSSCISIRSKTLKNIKKSIFLKKFNELWFDFRIATFFSLKKKQFNLLDEHLTYYRDYPASNDKKYQKFLNIFWWKRRLEAFQFLNYINKNYYSKNLFSFDYLVTIIINKFIFFFKLL